MALFVNQENTRTKLQQQIAEDLAKKAKKKALEGDTERPDGVDDAAYLKDTKMTTSLAWIWVLLGLIFVGVIVWLVAISI
jgi:hypothetical protein